MSAYLDKSKKNITAAQMLMEGALPDASIHCSYYAVVQHMLHIIHVKMKVSKEDFNVQMRNSKDGTHVYAGKQIEKELRNLNFNDYKWYQQALPALKKQREEADYHERNMTRDDAGLAQKRSKSLTTILLQILNKKSMTSKSYLERALTGLSENFPDICIRYGFDEMIDTYIVQIDPVETYNNNYDLDLAWAAIALSFNERFEACISFVSSESPLQVENVERIWNPAEREVLCTAEQEQYEEAVV